MLRFARAAAADSAAPEVRGGEESAALAEQSQAPSNVWAEELSGKTSQTGPRWVGAEIARLEGRGPCSGTSLRGQAIRSAHEQGFLQNEGLAHELGLTVLRVAADI